jgi:hypothetical protein
VEPTSTPPGPSTFLAPVSVASTNSGLYLLHPCTKEAPRSTVAAGRPPIAGNVSECTRPRTRDVCSFP